MQKYIHQLKQGDIVECHGAKFRILYDAKESQGHRPQAGHLMTAHGPCDVAYTEGQWIEGQTIPGYFGPKQNWTFQGNFLAGQYEVLA